MESDAAEICLHSSHGCEVRYAVLKAGATSEVHRHLGKATDFFVIDGELEVHRFLGQIGDASVERIQTLKAGEVFTVEAGIWHQLVAKTDVDMIETHWLPAVDPNDIERI